MRAAKLIDDSRSHPFAAQSSCSAGALRIDRLVPYGGPHHGGTEVMVRLSGGTGFIDLGDAKCAFGGTAVPAQGLNSSVLRCTSPAVELADEEFLGSLDYLHCRSPLESTVTVLVLILSGDVSDYTREVRDHLTVLFATVAGVLPSQVMIDIQAASVRLRVEIRTP
eukprot:jgi/Chrpa1/7621/Chrysochromulina_OHIO_Genome00016936-RA